MDLDRLDAALTFAGEHNSRGVAVGYRNGLVAERYWKGWNAETSSIISSATKSVVSVLVGMCVHDGAIANLDQSAADFLTDWKGNPQEAIRIRHLLNMTSGLAKPALWATRPGLMENEREFGTRLALAHEPGTVWMYHTIAYRLLFPLIEQATGTSLADYSRERLFEPLGMTHSHWRSRNSGGQTCFLNLICSLRDMVRFGQLVAQHGNWNGTQLVDRAYIETALLPSQKLNFSYGHLFWLNRPRQRLLPDCPSDTVVAMGAQDTRIYIVPSLELVVARMGNRVSPPGAIPQRKEGNPESFHNLFLRAICQAVQADGSSDYPRESNLGL